MAMREWLTTVQHRQTGERRTARVRTTSEATARSMSLANAECDTGQPRDRWVVKRVARVDQLPAGWR